MRLLLAEDEKELANALSVILQHNQYSVDVVHNGKDALDYLDTDLYDAAVLDIMMPIMDGLTVVKELRKRGSNLPVLLLTAKSEIDDRVTGLDAGADDYLTKPFSVEELLARLRVTQRRLALMGNETAHQAVFMNGNLKIDYVSGCVYLSEEELHLTPMEYKLLCLLAKNTGKVLTHKYILQNVWGSTWENDVASLRVFMATLRKKLEQKEDGVQYIQTHVGIGYRMLKID